MKESNGMMYFLCGLGIGAAAATLFAVKSGAETRAQIASAVGEGMDQLKTRAQDAARMVDDTIQAGRQTIQQKARDLSSAVEAGRQAYRDAVANKPGAMA